MVIEPTVGRIVWVRSAKNPDAQPLAAIVNFVHSVSLIGVTIFSPDGNIDTATVPLVQEDHAYVASGDWYAEWMPYQIGQAKKHAGAA